jgi:hypothetical protein
MWFAVVVEDIGVRTGAFCCAFVVRAVPPLSLSQDDWLEPTEEDGPASELSVRSRRAL